VFKKSHKKNRFISEPVLGCGERGICLLQKSPIKSTLRKAYYLSDTLTDTSFIRLLLF
jgi:hypothetical protein